MMFWVFHVDFAQDTLAFLSFHFVWLISQGVISIFLFQTMYLQVTAFCLKSVAQYCLRAVPCFPFFFFACYLALLRHRSSCVIWLLLLLLCKILKMTSIKSLWVDNLKQDGKENSLNLRDQLELEPVLPPLGCTTTHRLKVESTKAAVDKASTQPLQHSLPQQPRSDRAVSPNSWRLLIPDGFSCSGQRDY